MENNQDPLNQATSNPRFGQRSKELVLGFRHFISDYGVVPLAVGVVIGTALNDLVKSLVDGLIAPFIGLITPQTTLQNLQFKVGPSVFKVGMVINSTITFLIICLLIYLVAKYFLHNENLLKKN